VASSSRGSLRLPARTLVGGRRAGEKREGKETAFMTTSLDRLKLELERFGEANDAEVSERAGRMLNVTRETGEFLALLVQATVARRILEVGTSNGYSTIWLAEAARTLGGSVTTIERSASKAQMAASNFAKAGLSDVIRIVENEAGQALAVMVDGSIDLLFLDSERGAYPRWWPDVRRILRPGGLVIADNATSHPDEMAPFVSLVRSDPEFTTSTVPIGKGEFLGVKRLASLSMEE